MYIVVVHIFWIRFSNKYTIPSSLCFGWRPGVDECWASSSITTTPSEYKDDGCRGRLVLRDFPICKKDPAPQVS